MVKQRPLPKRARKGKASDAPVPPKIHASSEFMIPRTKCGVLRDDFGNSFVVKWWDIAYKIIPHQPSVEFQINGIIITDFANEFVPSIYKHSLLNATLEYDIGEALLTNKLVLYYSHRLLKKYNEDKWDIRMLGQVADSNKPAPIQKKRYPVGAELVSWLETCSTEDREQYYSDKYNGLIEES